MTSFSAARKNMVDCQIHTSSVINPAVLDAFENTPRELFVPESSKSVAYNDEDLVFKDGRFILEPMNHARMLQALELKPSDIVLDLGCAGGYSSAILSQIVTTVIAVEPTQKYLDNAQTAWDSLSFCNIVSYKNSLGKGCEEHGPYDAIIINGACAELPERIASQLSENGRMVYIQKDGPNDAGHITVVKKSGEGNQFSSTQIWDASSPYLECFQPKNGFSF